jgi:hypothetical protein
MGVNKQARGRATRHIENLPKFTVEQLTELCGALGAETKCIGKGGVLRLFDHDELVHSICRVIGQGTFADRLERFSDIADRFLSEPSGS